MSLRVLHIVDSLVPQADSVGAALPGLLRALDGTDCSGMVTVLDGRTDVDADFNNSRWTVEPWRRNATAELVEGADVVHIHGLTGRGSTAIARAAHKQGKPFILAPHGAFSSAVRSRRPLTRRVMGRFGDRALLRSAAAVQALHTVEANELRQCGPSRCIVQLPYSVDVATDMVDAAPRSSTNGDSGRCLLMLGPIDPVEGVVGVLKSVAEIGKAGNDWRVVLAGAARGEWRAMLEAGVRRKGSEDRVEFGSAADWPAQRAWLQKASLLVAGSLRIRPAVSIMQAVATGVPVLATNCVVPDELTEHVSVCEPTRAAIRMKLRETLELDEATRRERAGAALACFRSRLSWSEVAPKYAALYQQVSAAT